ncbi:MAG: DEAD/DEAH box helicase [Syntrophobacteria bacterium]
MERKYYRPRPLRRKRKNARPRNQKNPATSLRLHPRASSKLRPLLEQIGVPEAAPFVPDPFQQDAVRAVEQSDVLVTAPTGSGKTWIALKAIERLFAREGRSWYASPLKALSNSMYAYFCRHFGEQNVGILTGDRKQNPHAPIIVGTTEILRNQLYDAMYRGEDLPVELVVLDETHYLGDKDRGVVWEEVMIYLPARVRLLLLSATVSNAEQIAQWLEWLRQIPCKVVAAYERPVPLYALFMFPDGELTPLTQRGAMAGRVRHFLEHNPDAGLVSRRGVANFSQIIAVLRHLNLLPGIFFLKSRADCNQALQTALPRLSPDESDDDRRRFHRRLSERLKAHPYLKKHRQLAALRDGRVAAHHGGQLPQWKVLVETLMKEGELDAIFSTSTVAAGVNFPARTVVLCQSDRFNGRQFVPLSATDMLQMTGRAGRRGMDKVGFVLILPGPYQDVGLICNLLHSLPECIDSQIHITFSMVLNLLLSHRPEEIRELLSCSFATYQELEEHRSLLEEVQQVERELATELGGAACGDTDAVLRTLSRKRELERQLQHARRELRRGRQRLLKEAYLSPGRLFRSKKGEFFVTLRQERRNDTTGVLAVRVKPRSRVRRGRLHSRWVRLENVASVLDCCFDLDGMDRANSWLQTVTGTPLEAHPPLEFNKSLPFPEQEAWEKLKAGVEDLQAQIAALPCGGCPHLGKCEPKKGSKPFREKIDRALRLYHQLDALTNRLWHEFSRYFRFLQQEDYADRAGRLSSDGVWASQLRLDQPLMIAEGIRRNVLPREEPAMLAGLIATFMGDRDYAAGAPLKQLAPQHAELGRAFAKMTSALRPLRLRLREAGFAVHPLSFWPVVAIYTWASGGPWEEVLRISGLDEGDLAMLVYRTADGLRQLEGLTQSHPLLAATATRATQYLLREPVLVPT